MSELLDVLASLLSKSAQLTLVLFLFVAPPAIAQSLPVALPFSDSAQLVHSSARGSDRVDIVAGQLKYIEAGDREGYQPERSIPLTARQKTFTYNYRSGVSAYQLSDEIESQLRKAGYQIVYRCQRSSCGDIDAWRVFLGGAVAGSESSQYYLLARKNRIDMAESFVQIYANDLRQGARLIVNNYEGEVVIDTTSGASSEGLVRIPFALGSAELTAGGRDALRSFVFQLSSSGVVGVKSIEVTGYTDAQGDERLNQQLSKRRAEVIARWLGSEDVLRGVAITEHAGGVAGAANTGRDGYTVPNPYRKAEIKIVRGGAEKVAAN